MNNYPDCVWCSGSWDDSGSSFTAFIPAYCSMLKEYINHDQNESVCKNCLAQWLTNEIEGEDMSDEKMITIKTTINQLVMGNLN